ncbi:MAG: extracellular solute-binding protein [Lachnospiraceae bacterium]|nr:extracellular solute-binding protein [Ruminococcus sp.]MCM1274196.1 extracellular solute-binding protein [Lachnospiraceae bacterium]
MKKRILAALVASAAVLSLAGCNTDNNNGSGAGNSNSNSNSNSGSSNAGDSGNSNAGTTAAPEEGTLTILTWNGNSDTKTMVETFLEAKGYPADSVKFVGIGDNGEGARDGYKQYIKGDGDADLFIMDAGWTMMYTYDNEVSASYETIGLSKSDFPDAFPYTLSYGSNGEGQLMANSFQATPGGFIYRSDLAEQYLGIKSPDEMTALISDWDKFKAAGKTLAEASGGTCALQSTEGGMWEVFQANRSQPWVVDGKLVLGEAEAFYDLVVEMKNDKSLGLFPQWETPWYQSVKDGSALGDFAPTWGLTTNEGSILFNMTDGSEELGKNMAFCEAPSSYFWGGSYIGVSNKCNNPVLAKEFIEYFCKDADSMKAYAEKTGDFVNNKSVMSSLTTSNKLLNGQNHYTTLVKVMDKLDLEGKLTQYDSTIKGCFNDSVNALLDGLVSTKEEAIVKFKQDVKAALPDIDVE